MHVWFDALCCCRLIGGLTWGVLGDHIGVCSLPQRNSLLCCIIVFCNDCYTQHLLECKKCGLEHIHKPLKSRLAIFLNYSAVHLSGRRRSLFLALLLNAAFGALSAAAKHAVDLVFLRLAAGIGVGGSVPVVFALLAELLPVGARCVNYP